MSTDSNDRRPNPRDEPAAPRAASALSLPPDARCRNCRYPLRDLPQPRCPECGATFDPDNPNTYDWFRPDPTVIIRCLPPPPRSYQRAVYCNAVLTLYAFSFPRDLSWAVTTAALLWAAILLYWFTHTALGFGSLPTNFPQSDAEQETIRRRWLVAPAVLFVVLLILWTDFPRRACCTLLILPSAAKVGAELSAAAPGAPLPDIDWLGLFPIERVGRHTDAILLDVAAYEGGLAWSPTDPPACYERCFSPLFGDWYIWWHDRDTCRRSNVTRLVEEIPLPCGGLD